MCSEASDCNLVSEGACEADGRCSYPDASCESDRRFASATDVGGPCVPHSGADGSEDTAAVDDSSGGGEGDSGGTTDGSESDTGLEAYCGNGQVDPGEDCDEPNDIDGDGCNVDCVRSGTELWADELDFAGADDHANGLAIADDGRFAVVGYVTDADGDQNAFVQLRDPNGEEIWFRDFVNPGADVGEQVFFDAEGGVVACGTIIDAQSGLEQGWVRRYTPEGDTTWDVVLDDPGGSWIRACRSLGDGTFAVAGMVDFGGDYDTGSGLVARFDVADGNERWRQSYPGGGLDLRGVTTDVDGDIVAGGLALGPRLCVLLGYTLEGEVSWEPPMGAYNELVDECFAIDSDEGGGVYAMGRMLGDAGGDGWYGYYDGKVPTPIWFSETDTVGGEEFHEVAVHPDGDLVFVGSRSGESHDIWVIRYGPDHTFRWETVYQGDAQDRDKAWDVGFAPDGTVLVVGYATHVATGADVWLRRYAP